MYIFRKKQELQETEAICVCVCEREKDKERERERRETDREIDRERQRWRERERENNVDTQGQTIFCKNDFLKQNVSKINFYFLCFSKEILTSHH